MKAYWTDRYGGPEVLKITDVEQPTPGPDGVLVKVLASSVNPADWRLMRATPAFARLTMGLLRPKHRIPGSDLAGRVASVGSAVTRFKPGDMVFGTVADVGLGAFAEYAVVPAAMLALIPPGITPEIAATVPMTGITALQGLLQNGPIRPGQTVLVNGASGGVGSFGVQLAKAFGAVVTGVTSTRNLDLARSFGADHLVDYTREDFTRTGKTYDLVFDAIGNRSVKDLRRALTSNGKASVAGFTSVAGLAGIGLRGGKTVRIVAAHGTTADLERLAAFLHSGALRPSIERTYPFAGIPDAIRHLETMRARGKIAINPFP